MDKILARLTKKGIPAIPIHDSVIVPEQNLSAAEAIMIKSYQEVTKTNHIPWISIG